MVARANRRCPGPCRPVPYRLIGEGFPQAPDPAVSSDPARATPLFSPIEDPFTMTKLPSQIDMAQIDLIGGFTAPRKASDRLDDVLIGIVALAGLAAVVLVLFA